MTTGSPTIHAQSALCAGVCAAFFRRFLTPLLNSIQFSKPREITWFHRYVVWWETFFYFFFLFLEILGKINMIIPAHHTTHFVLLRLLYLSWPKYFLPFFLMLLPIYLFLLLLLLLQILGWTLEHGNLDCLMSVAHCCSKLFTLLLKGWCLGFWNWSDEFKWTYAFFYFRSLLAKGFVRLGKWFVQPCTGNDNILGKR